MTFWAILAVVIGLVAGYFIGYVRGYVAGGQYVAKVKDQQISEISHRDGESHGPLSHSVPDQKTKTLSSRRVLSLIAVLIGFFLVAKVFVQADNPRTRARYALKAQIQRIGDRQWRLTLMNDSAFRAAFSGLSSRAARAKLSDLSRRGATRLSDSQQIRRITLYGAMFNASPDDKCTDTDQFVLDSARFEEWMALELAAAQAEIRGTPSAFQADSTAIAWAKETIMNSLTPAGRKIISKTISKTVNPLTPPTAADKCTFARVISSRISVLPESQQADYARAVATIWLGKP